MIKFETKEQYEAWIRARRRVARIKNAITVGLIIALLGALAVFAGVVSAAPMKNPDTRSQGLKEPDAAPQKGVTLREAKESCERKGGHWFEEDGGEQMPNHKIIGCLFAVPKSAK